MHPALFRHRFSRPHGIRDGDAQRFGDGPSPVFGGPPIAMRHDPEHPLRYANNTFPFPPSASPPPNDSHAAVHAPTLFKYLAQHAPGMSHNKPTSPTLSQTAPKAIVPTESLTPPLSPAPAANVVSIGDVLMLSQVAWRISRHFSPQHSPGTSIPPEFVMIEDELTNFSKSLKRLGEALVFEGIETFVHTADQKVQDNISTILRSCHRILEDLESFTFSYQVRMKLPSARGMTMQRTWRATVLNDYQYVIWTANGGTIRNLEEMLHIHTVAVTILRTILEGFVRHLSFITLTNLGCHRSNWRSGFRTLQTRSTISISAIQKMLAPTWPKLEATHTQQAARAHCRNKPCRPLPLTHDPRPARCQHRLQQCHQPPHSKQPQSKSQLLPDRICRGSLRATRLQRLFPPQLQSPAFLQQTSPRRSL